MSTDQCQHKGQEAALDIATAACKLSQVRADDVLLPCCFSLAGGVGVGTAVHVRCVHTLPAGLVASVAGLHNSSATCHTNQQA